MNEYMVLGLAVGGALGIVIVALLFRLKVLDMTFDERQERARGVAFRYGFYTLAVCVMAYGFADMNWHWCDTMMGCGLSVCVGATVMAVTAICRDAYLSIYERPRQVMTVFAAAALINLALGLYALTSGDAVVDGVVTFRLLNLPVGIMILVVLAAYGLRCLGSRDGEEDEAV